MLVAGSYDNYYDTPDVDSLIRLYGCDLGMRDYPIWDESKREWLNEKIINHFRYRKISAQTSTQFVFYLNRALDENMPSINPVFVALEKAAQEESWLSYMTGDKSTTTNNAGNESEQIFLTRRKIACMKTAVRITQLTLRNQQALIPITQLLKQLIMALIIWYQRP